MNTLESFWQWYLTNQHRKINKIDITFVSKRKCHQIVIDYIDIKWYLIIPYNIDFIDILQYQNDIDKFIKKFIDIIKGLMEDKTDETI